MLYEAKHVLEMMSRAKNYKGVPRGYHIIGIRSEADESDRFDDMFYLFKGKKLVMTTTGTTNPGAKILLGGFLKWNKKGAAVLASNYVYNNVWIFGKHGGWMPALRQRGARVLIFRDGNKNRKSEQIGTSEWGWFGLNFHTATKNYLKKLIIKLIGGWSAGCQVCNNTVEYMRIINLCKSQKTITYTLLDEFTV